MLLHFHSDLETVNEVVICATKFLLQEIFRSA